MRMPRRFVVGMSHATDAASSLSSGTVRPPAGFSRAEADDECQYHDEPQSLNNRPPCERACASAPRSCAARSSSTLERSADETHVRIAEQARDTEDDSFSNLIVDLNLAEIDRDADELRRIDTALARLNEGSYGQCESCGQEIPQARLQAEPTALRCVQCQELYEKTHAGDGTPRL